MEFEGPKIAKRKIECRVCGREIKKGELYFVGKELVVTKVSVGYNPKWYVAAWRYPTRVRRALRRKIVCLDCRKRFERELIELETKIKEEWETKIKVAELIIKSILSEHMKIHMNDLVRSFEKRSGGLSLIFLSEAFTRLRDYGEVIVDKDLYVRLKPERKHKQRKNENKIISLDVFLS